MKTLVEAALRPGNVLAKRFPLSSPLFSTRPFCFPRDSQTPKNGRHCSSVTAVGSATGGATSLRETQCIVRASSRAGADKYPGPGKKEQRFFFLSLFLN